METTDPAQESGQLEPRRAEVVSIWPRDGRIGVHGIVYGLEPKEAGAERTCSVVLMLRGSPDITRTYTVALAQEGQFEVGLPVEDLAPPGQFDREYWDLYLTTGTGDDEIRLRIGRHLDDIDDKKKVMKFPGQRISGAAEDIRVTPYYTDYNNLSIRARQLRPSEATT